MKHGSKLSEDYKQKPAKLNPGAKCISPDQELQNIQLEYDWMLAGLTDTERKLHGFMILARFIGVGKVSEPA